MSKYKNSKSVASQIVLHAVIIFLLFLMIYPLAMSLWCSVKTDMNYDATKFFPTLPFRISNVSTAFNIVKVYIFNTVIVAVVAPILQLFIASLAAYAFARVFFPFKKFLFSMVMFLVMIPGILTLVPQYLLYRSFGLYDSLWSLIIPQMTGGCIFGVFLLKATYESLPKELFESAKIDGANEFQCYIRMAIPLSVPILLTIMIMTIVGIWNDYIWPRLMLTEERYTISAGLLLTFKSEYTSNMPVMFAGYLVASSPLILLFIFANKFYIQGLVSTSIKM